MSGTLRPRPLAGSVADPWKDAHVPNSVVLGQTVRMEIRPKECVSSRPDLSRSLKAVGTGADRSAATYDLLLVIHSVTMGLSRTVCEITAISVDIRKLFAPPCI